MCGTQAEKGRATAAFDLIFGDLIFIDSTFEDSIFGGLIFDHSVLGHLVVGVSQLDCQHGIFQPDL
jgi:hypothetical protein